MHSVQYARKGFELRNRKTVWRDDLKALANDRAGFVIDLLGSAENRSVERGPNLELENVEGDVGICGYEDDFLRLVVTSSTSDALINYDAQLQWEGKQVETLRYRSRC